MVESNEKIKVFIDSSIFIGYKYDILANNDFIALSKYIEAGKVELYTHEIVLEELRSNFKKKAEKELERIASSFKELTLLKASPLGFFNSKPQLNEITKEGLNLIETFFKDNKAKVLGYDKVSLAAIFNDYFNERTPFANKKNKKSEFPDAVIIASIKNHLSTEKLHIVTGDQGWNDSFKDANYKIHQQLKNFLDYVTKREELYAQIYEYFQDEKIKQIIKDQIEEFYYDHEITVFDPPYADEMSSGERYDEAILNSLIISLNEFTIQQIDHVLNEEKIVNIFCNYNASLELSLTCSYADYLNAPWDSETKSYVMVETKSVDEVHKVNTDISLTVTFNIEENFSILNEFETSPPLEFDRYTKVFSKIDGLTRDFYHRYNVSYGTELIRRFHCVNCHHNIFVNYKDYAEHVGSHDHGDNKMGVEKDYKVQKQALFCPHCKEEYEISGDFTEYPLGVIDDDNVNIKRVNLKNNEN